MNLGRLIPKLTSDKHVIRNWSSFDNLETGKGVFYNRENSYSIDTPEFYILLINLFDRSMVNFNLHTLSIEQQNLLEEYYKQGNTVTRQHTCAWLQDYDLNDGMSFLLDIWKEENLEFILEYNENYKELYNKIEKIIRRLDDFLGSYLGEEYIVDIEGEKHGRYTRYSKKQFYSKCKSFGKKATVINRIK